MPVIAISRPSDAFELAIDACRIAVQFMTPVILLSDNFIANGAEPWALPDLDDLKPFPVKFTTEKGRRLPVLWAQREPCAPLGQAGHAGHGVPDWRARESANQQHQLRPGQPPGDDGPASRQGAQGGRYDSDARRLKDADSGDLLVCGLGLDRRHPQASRGHLPRERTLGLANCT